MPSCCIASVTAWASLGAAFARCWLAFRDVEPHTDDSFYYLSGVAARFLHVVLQGCATVRDWSGSIQVKRGDVFSLNPHALHSAPSDTYCLTACFIVHPRCIK